MQAEKSEQAEGLGVACITMHAWVSVRGWIHLAAVRFALISEQSPSRIATRSLSGIVLSGLYKVSLLTRIVQPLKCSTGIQHPLRDQYDTLAQERLFFRPV